MQAKRVQRYWVPMSGILGQVKHWRAKADELRAAADNVTNAIARDSMLEMADGYDHLADKMERHAVKVRPRNVGR